MLVFRTIVFGVFAIAIGWSAIGYGVDKAVDRAIQRSAMDKAQNWGGYMASRVPNVDTLIATGIPTREQKRVIHEVSNVGNIFRFKLFSADGRLSMVSDDSNIADTVDGSDLVDPEALISAQTGTTIVAVYDGSNKANRPNIYAEAYVPLINSFGMTRGVIEVYLDETTNKAHFQESFRNFGKTVALFCSLAFALPSLAFLMQRMLTERSRRSNAFLARCDPLTGLTNRREFVKQAEQSLSAETLSVVCYLDVDRFKTINDTYGHAAGDAFLAHIAGILRENTRSEDLLSRFGGDEFVTAFQNISLPAAVTRIKAIVQDCAGEFKVNDTVIQGSVSVGVAEVETNTSIEKILQNADTALYHVKSKGRDNFAIYGEEMGAEMRKRHALEARLRQATRDSDFQVHYQPLVDGKGRRIIGHEALLRLNDKDGSAIAPAVFIPLAEELGLIEDIGRWTIRTAMREIMTYKADSMLAINVSTAQFRSGHLVKIVTDALYETGFAANRLELEITESLLLDDSPQVAAQIDALKKMGVAIAMDDFGTGFSSLSYLWKYGFDRLKIDRSFIAALDENPERSREIIETLVLLGTRLGMQITAEGVENEKQSNLLRSLGCDVLQGFLFGKASPLATIQSEIDISLITASDDVATRVA